MELHFDLQTEVDSPARWEEEEGPVWRGRGCRRKTWQNCVSGFPPETNGKSRASFKKWPDLRVSRISGRFECGQWTCSQVVHFCIQNHALNE
jgi:hypothetical protein